jgi:hypothetical protein
MLEFNLIHVYTCIYEMTTEYVSLLYFQVSGNGNEIFNFKEMFSKIGW